MPATLPCVDIHSDYDEILDLCDQHQEPAAPAALPDIKLHGDYTELFDICKERREPVLITQEGKDGIALMNIETYNALFGTMELYKLIKIGIDDIEQGRTLTEEEMDEHIETMLSEM